MATYRCLPLIHGSAQVACQAPQVSFDAVSPPPGNDGRVHAATVQFRVRIEGPSPDSVYLEVDGKPFRLEEPFDSPHYFMADPAGGEYQLVLRSLRGLSQRRSDPLSVIVALADRAPPTLLGWDPPPGETQAPIAVTATFSEPVALGAVPVWGEPFRTSFTWTWPPDVTSATLPALAVRDRAGNLLQLDGPNVWTAIQPASVRLSPTGPVLTNGSVPLQLTAIVTGRQPSSVIFFHEWLLSEDTLGEVFAPPWALGWDLSSAPEGDHSLWVQAVYRFDSASYGVSSPVTRVTIDRTAPVATAAPLRSASDNLGQMEPISLVFSGGLDLSTVTDSTVALTASGVARTKTLAVDQYYYPGTRILVGPMSPAAVPGSSVLTVDGVADAAGNAVHASFTFFMPSLRPFFQPTPSAGAVNPVLAFTPPTYRSQPAYALAYVAPVGQGGGRAYDLGGNTTPAAGATDLDLAGPRSLAMVAPPGGPVITAWIVATGGAGSVRVQSDWASGPGLVGGGQPCDPAAWCSEPALAAVRGQLAAAWTETLPIGPRVAAAAASPWSDPLARLATAVAEDANRPSLAAGPGFQPYVALHRNATTAPEVAVLAWDGAAWNQVGLALGPACPASAPSLRFDPGGWPVAAFCAPGAAGDEVRVARFDGAAWTALAPGATSPGAGRHPSLGISPDGRVWVAFVEDVGGVSRAVVSRLDGASWRRVADPLNSDPLQDAGPPSLDVDLDGQPGAVWTEAGMVRAWYYNGW